MNERKTKRKIVIGTIYDGKAMETYLERMAAKGWLLKEVKGIIWHFEECEPKQVRFQVDCFDKATSLDVGPEAKTQEYIEYCEACGWKYIHSMGKMQIFYAEDMEIPEIQTDDKMKLKSMWKGSVIYLFTFFLLGFQNLGTLYSMVIDRLFSQEYYLFANTVAGGIFFEMGVFEITFGILMLVAAGRVIFFFARNGIRIKKGKKIVSYSYKGTRFFYGIYLGICVLYMLWLVIFGFNMKLGWMVIALLVAMLAILGGYFIFISHKRVKREHNIIALVVMSVALFGAMGGCVFVGIWSAFRSDEVVQVGDKTYYYSTADLPIYLEDLGYKKEAYNAIYEESYADKSASIFAERYEYSTYYVLDKQEDGPAYDITIFKGKFSWVSQRYNDLLLNYPEHDIIKGPDWAGELWKDGQIYIVDNGVNKSLCVIMEDYTLLVRGAEEAWQIEKIKEAYGL